MAKKRKGAEEVEGTGRTWADLPEELLVDVAKRLHARADFLRFCATCSSWRASARTLLVSPFDAALKVPQLFVSTGGQIIDRTTAKYGRPMTKLRMCSIYLVQKKRKRWVACVQEKPYVPGKNGLEFLFKSAVGYRSKTIAKESNILDLSLSELCKYYEPAGPEGFCPLPFSRDINYLAGVIEKIAVIFPRSVAGDYAALGLFGDEGKLFFLKSSAEGIWTSIDDSEAGYNDVIDYNDKFYAIHYTGKFLQIDLSSKVTEISSPINNDETTTEITGTSGTHKIFVKSTGELLVLNKYIEVNKSGGIGAMPKSLWFEVYKLNDERETHKLVEIQSLGDRTVFLSSKYGYSVSARHLAGCTPNCIYFTEQCDNAYHMDWFSLRRVLRPHFHSVFNLEDGTYKRMRRKRIHRPIIDKSERTFHVRPRY